MNERQALTLARTMLPNASLDELLTLGEALMTPAQAPTASPAAGAPPAATTTPAAAGGAPPAVTTPAGGLKAQVSAKLPAGFTDKTKTSGTPPPPQVALAAAKAKSTNDLIDQAIAALEPFKTQNTADDTINMARAYRQGVYEPLSAAAAQLSDLAGLQQTASQALTGGGSRAVKLYVDRRQHVPRLPSGRQINFADMGLSGGTVNYASQMLKGDEAGFDTPQMMYEKLIQAKKLNQNFLNDIGTTFAAPPVGSAPPGTELAGKTPVSKQGPDGKWYISY